MRQDSFQFCGLEDSKKTFRHRNGGMFRISTGGKGVGGVLGDDINPRLGKAGLDSESFDHLVQVGGFLDRDFLSSAHGQGDLVAEPVTNEIHDQGHEQGEVKARSPSEGLADEQ